MASLSPKKNRKIYIFKKMSPSKVLENTDHQFSYDGNEIASSRTAHIQNTNKKEKHR